MEVWFEIKKKDVIALVEKRLLSVGEGILMKHTPA